MKAKRLLAIIMSVVMIATSSNLALDAEAANSTADVVTVASAEGTGTGDGNDIGTFDGGDVTGPDLVIENDHFGVTFNGTLKIKNGLSKTDIKGDLKLPAEAVTIPLGIFDKNTKVKSLAVPEDSKLTTIEAGAFEETSLKTLTIPKNVTEIADETFKNSNIQRITYAEGSKLNKIGEEAFAGSDLVSMVMPGEAKVIGAAAFSGCLSLQSFSLVNVETIEANAFKSCSGLNVFAWGDKLTSVGNNAFQGAGLEKIELNNESGANITTWGSNVFEKCEYLTRVVLHRNMTIVSEGMFKDCTALSYVSLPENCTVISEEAFSGCVALNRVTIPSKVGVIEAKAFAGCQELAEVTIEQRGDNGNAESNIILAETAFPQKTMTMKGYDGTVEDYADRKGYTFVSLFPTYTLTIDVNDDEYGEATLSKKSARQGDVIEVTVTPAEGYRLKASTFKYNGNAIDTLVEEAEGSQVFSFVMPNENVSVEVDFEKTSVSYGKLSPSFVQTNSQMIYTWDKTNNTLTFDKAGLSAKLVVKGAKSNPGSWMFDYASKDAKVAVIGTDGVIYARGKGTTTITATLKSDSTKKVSFKVTVNANANIDKVKLKFSDLGKARQYNETIDGEDFSVIQYTKSNLAKSGKDFKVTVNATSGEDETSLFVNSDWKTANEDIAYPEAESSIDNTNKILVNKGVTGETAITVTTTNGQTGKNKVEYDKQSFIIRVIDVTPRLMQNTLTLNTQCTTGTKFDLLSVYGYEVETTGLEVVKEVKEGTITEYEPNSYVAVNYANGAFYMTLTEEGKAAVKKKSGDISYKNMYIQGEYTYNTGYGKVTEVFRTPIKNLVLTQKELKPSVKLKGKLNLFFNGRASVEECGEVVITQSLKDLKVVKYELVSAANYKEEGSEEVDSFANNFKVTAAGVISRTENDLMRDEKGKAIVSGYVKITYDGYEPCYAKITIPTKNTKPAYVLSKTKATVNTYSDGYQLKVQLLEKKSKKALSLANLKALSFDESSSGTTTGLFEELNTEAAKASDTITLQIKNAQKGKAVINVEMASWSEPMKFIFNLNVTSKAPTVKAKPATMTLNNLCVGQEASTKLTINQDDAELVGMSDIMFAGKAALASDADKIQFAYSDGKLYAYADETIAKGSYKFKITPEIAYSNGKTEDAKAFAVTVKVVDSKLTAKLKPATVSLNNNYAGKETVTTTYTIKNFPAGGNVHILDDDVVIEGKNAAAESVLSDLAFSFGTTDCTIEVSQTDMVRKTGTYKYTVSGLKTLVEGAEVEIQPFVIGVKIIKTNPKLTVKSSGSMNPGNSSSGIVYKLVTKNVSANIESLVIKELNTTSGLNKPYDELVHFKVGDIVWNNKGGIESVEILAKDTVTLDAKKTYKLRIGAVIEGSGVGDEPLWTSDLKITPKQVLPKIKTDVNEATLYAGVAMNHPKRSQEVLITKTTQKDAEIASVGLAKNTPDNIKKAFKVTFDPETQKAKITLLRPDLLRPNTTYTVTMEVKTIGQMANTAGPQFTMKVKVLN